MNTETETTTVYDLAREIDPADPGQGVNSVIGFLGHLDGLTMDTVLDPEDIACVRDAWNESATA